MKAKRRKPSLPKQSKVRAISKRLPKEFSEIAASPRDTQMLSKILSSIYIHTGVDITNYKLTTVYRRIQRQLILHKFSKLAQYAAYLDKNPAETKVLCEDLFIHVTEFFRDASSFKALADTVIPNLVKSQKSGVPLRIWVPGCSTGEEAYSIAITLLEFAEQNDLEIPFHFFATDISEPTLELARAGYFSKQQVQSVSRERLKKFFEPTKDGFKIKKFVRSQFIFSRHDVSSNPPFAKIDLISCRNVLIYFSPLLQQRVMPIFHYALNPKGYLWLGRSEVPTGISKLFRMQSKVHKIYSKIAVAGAHFHFPHLRLGDKIPSDKKDINVDVEFVDLAKGIDRILMSRFSPPGLLVNAAFEILQVRGRIDPYVQIASGQPSYDLLRMIRPELLPSLRQALQLATKEKRTIKKPGLTYTSGDSRKVIDIEVLPINPQALAKDLQFLIVFLDSGIAPSKPLRRKKLSSNRSVQIHDGEYLRELLQEIDSMREYQQTLSEGYETSREELTASNEELQSTLEEFQSNNEELETAKEELQASNEELSTLNSELQTRADDLSASEERFRLLIDSVNDYAIFMIDSEGRVSTWNEGARRFHGYEADEIIGKHFSVFYPVELRSGDRPNHEIDTARTQGRFEEEAVRSRKDGSTFFANVIVTAIRDEAGNLKGFAKVTRDISERKLAEKSLLESESKYRLMIEVVKDYAILRLDTNGNILTWNEGARNLKGYEAEEVKGKHFSIFYGKEDLENGKPSWELQQSTNIGRYEEEGWRIKRDGSKFWANVVITAIRGPEQNLLGFTKVTRDLTDRRIAEQHLKQSEERFRLLVENVKDYAIFMLTPDFRVATWNEGAQRIKGYGAKEIVGKHFSIFYPPEDVAAGKIEREIAEVMELGRAEDEGWRVRKDGTKFWGSVVLTKITDPTGQMIGIAKVTRDLTERKAMIDNLKSSNVELEHRVGERTTELSKAVQARDEFISVASHELKTPLTAIRLHAQLMQREIHGSGATDGNGAGFADFANKIDRQVDRIRRLVEDMFDVTRIHSGNLRIEPTEVNLSTLVTETVENFATEFERCGCVVSTEIAPGVVGMWDHYRLEQVVLNLLSNATKYGARNPIQIRVWREKGIALLAVQDGGVGIAESDVHRIFERFERAISADKVSGLGLGLYITRQILEVHRGSIKVESELGKGSEFCVSLPLNPDYVKGAQVAKDFDF